MNVLAIAGGATLLVLVAWDAFEAMLLPRRVLSSSRFARLLRLGLWWLWSLVARRIGSSGRRESFLALFAPLTVLLLLGIWASGMILGFAILQWGLGGQIGRSDGQPTDFGNILYMSGTNFFTLGLGDFEPLSPAARFLTVVEVGTGFALLALVLSYLPVLWQSFARREAPIMMLTMWAGTPSSAGGLLQRMATGGSLAALPEFLKVWEHWSAELLQTQLSYPVLAYYRSQHEHQSWLAALTVVLDTCSLKIACLAAEDSWSARLTFSIGQHAATNMCQVLGQEPVPPASDRLAGEDLRRLTASLKSAGVEIDIGERAEARLTELRRSYEPFVNALAMHLLVDLPPWLPPEDADEKASFLD